MIARPGHISLMILTKWKSRFIGKNTEDCNSTRFSLWMTFFFFFLSNALSGHIFKIKKLIGKTIFQKPFSYSLAASFPPSLMSLQLIISLSCWIFFFLIVMWTLLERGSFQQTQTALYETHRILSVDIIRWLLDYLARSAKAFSNI